MNEIPPLSSLAVSSAGQIPSAEPPQDIRGLMGAVESLIRHPEHLPYHLTRAGVGQMLSWLAVVTMAGSLVYGFIAGTFSGGTQLWAAPLKIAGGLLFAGAICLPSLYVFACLSGARASLAEIAGSLAGMLALSTVLLLSFAPVLWVFSQSTESLAAMGMLSLLFWFVAAGFGLRLLARCFDRFQSRNAVGLVCWSMIFLLVSLQMTVALRPILGRADTLLPVQKKFFLEHWADCLDGKYPPRHANPAPSPAR